MFRLFKKAKTKIALLFPGQTFQSVGMGLGPNGDPVDYLEQTIIGVKQVIDPIQVERVKYLMLVNPKNISPEEKRTLEKEINRTDNAQLALFFLYTALWKKY